MKMIKILTEAKLGLSNQNQTPPTPFKKKCAPFFLTTGNIFMLPDAIIVLSLNKCNSSKSC